MADYNIKQLLSCGKVFYRMSTTQFTSVDKETVSQTGFSGCGQSTLPKLRLTQVSQDQFIKELNPESHIVNDNAHRSDTPITRNGQIPTKLTNSEIVDWKKRARVAIPKQKNIADRQCIHMIGNDFDFDLIDENKDKVYSEFKKMWKYFHIHKGVSQSVLTGLTTGDCAIYFYVDEYNDVQYDVWSYKYGNDVSHHPATEDQNECITRRYFKTVFDENGEDKKIEVVEVYDKSRISTYTKDAEGSNSDEWALLKSENHGFSQIPVAYNKLDDVAWGAVQGLIDKKEASLSDLRESNEYFQFQILFLKGKVKVLPNASKQGKVIQGDKDSDIKEVEPQSKPESFVTEVGALTEEIHNGSGVVVIDPEVLKGDSSGAYVKSVYFPATSYALNQQIYWAKFFTKTVSIAKEAIGKSLGKVGDYVGTRIAWELHPFVPQNELEQAMINSQAISAGSRSKKTGASLLKGNAPNEIELIEAEQDELLNKQFQNPLNNIDS
jgi:hypothetical protein